MNHGIVSIAHLAAELPGDCPARPVDQGFRDHGGWWQFVVLPRHLGVIPDGVSGRREDGRVVAGTRLSVATEPKVLLRPTGEHEVMAQRVAVGRVGHRAADGPQVTSLGQSREVFADVDARSPCCDRAEFATDRDRRIGFQVKTVLLGQSAREEDVDAATK